MTVLPLSLPTFAAWRKAGSTFVVSPSTLPYLNQDPCFDAVFEPATRIADLEKGYVGLLYGCLLVQDLNAKSDTPWLRVDDRKCLLSTEHLTLPNFESSK